MTYASRRVRAHLPWVGVGALLVVALIGACAQTAGSGGLRGQGGASGSVIQPLSKADGWRDGLLERFDHDPPFGLVEVAFDRDTAERAWRENVPADQPARTGRPEQPGRYGDLDAVDFTTHAVVVWSAGQSGSCPGWLADVRTRGERVEVVTGQAGSACTDDYRWYRMVLAVAREQLPDPDALPTTDVAVDGRTTGRYSLVDTYPAPGRSGD